MKMKPALVPMTAQLAPVFTAALPAGIYCNVPTATSFHVYDAFTDVGLDAAMNNYVATDPLGGSAVEATTGLRTLSLPPLGTLLLPPSNRLIPGLHGLLTMQPSVQWQVDPLCAIWAAVCAPAMDGLVCLSLLSVKETCGAQRPWGSETMSYPMFQKTATTRTASPEIWLGLPFGGASFLHQPRLHHQLLLQWH